MCRQECIDRLAPDEVRFALIKDGETLLESYTAGLLPDNIVRQPMQRTDAIFIECLQGIIEKAFDARFEIIHRRIDQGDDKHFLFITKPPFLNELSRQRGEDVRLTCTRDSSNTKAAAV